MKDKDKTKARLIKELEQMRRKLRKMEALENESRRCQERLRKKVIDAQRYLDIAAVIIVVIGADRKVNLINKTGCDVLGYSEREILGKDWFANFIPKNKRKRVKSAFSELMAGNIEPVEYFESPVLTKRGEERLVEWHNTYLKDASGSIYATLSSGKDITERRRAEEALKESEEKMRAVADTALDAIIIIDNEVRIIYWNTAAERIFGYSSQEALGEKIYSLIIPRKYHDALKKGFNRFGTTGRGPFIGRVVQLSARRKDGTEFSVEHSISAVKIRGAWYAAGIIKDITERMRAEEDLRQSREQLRNLALHLQSVREEERMQIARDIHDEFGQVLTALKIDLSWMGKKLYDDQGQLLKKSKKMSRLIDNAVKTVQRISSELRPALLDDLGLVAAIEWLAEEWQNRTGIECDLTVDPEEIILDKDLSTAVFRTFQEVLTNVARHADATMVDVDLKKDNAKLVLNVMDNGRGITESEISDPKSFGLIGIRERCYPWAGVVKIKGIKGKGTTVTVSIPLDKKVKGP